MAFAPIRLDGGGLLQCFDVADSTVAGLSGATVSAGNTIAGSDTQGVYRTTTATVGDTWLVRNKGVGNVTHSRQVAAIRWSRREADTIYAATGEQGAEGGLLVSTNKGTSWAIRAGKPQFAGNQAGSPLSGDGWKRSTGALIVQDTGSDWLFMGTYKQGVLRSANNGFDNFPTACTMAGVAPGTGSWFCRSLVQGTSATTLYAAFYDSSGTTGAVWKSTNGHAVTPDFTKLTGSPATPEELLVLPNGNVYAACGNNGLYRSKDGGTTWDNLNGTSIPDLGGYWTALDGYTSGGNDIILAACSHPSTGANQACSLTIPSTFPTSGSISYANIAGTVQRNTVPPGNYTWWAGDSGTGGQAEAFGKLGFQNPYLRFDPNDGTHNKVYIAGSQGFWRSADGGSTWTVANGGMPQFLGHPLAADPNTNAHILFGDSDWNCFDDTSPGTENATSLQNNSPYHGQGFSLAFDPVDSTVYNGSGTKYTNSNGQVFQHAAGAINTWTKVGGNAPNDFGTKAGGNVPIGLCALRDAGNNKVVLAAAWGGGLWRWTSATGWVQKSTAISASTTPVAVCVPFTHAAGSKYVYVFDRKSGLYRSTDYGNTWALIWSITGNQASDDPAINPAKASELWITVKGTLYQLSGVQSGTVGSGITKTTITAVGTNAGPVTVSTTGVVYCCTGDSGSGADVLQSPDGGATWTSIGGTAFAEANCSPEHIVVSAADGNIYVSGSNVVTWSNAGNIGTGAGSMALPPMAIAATGTTSSASVSGTFTATFTSNGSYTWTCPAGVTAVKIECWGAGGGGGDTSGSRGGGGGGGGEYAAEPAWAVTPGTAYPVSVGVAGAGSSSAGTGGDGIRSTFNTTDVIAHGGKGGPSLSGGGAGGTGSTNTTHHDGGAGGTGYQPTSSQAGGGGGGSSAGPAAAGGAGGNGGTNTGGTAGTAPAGGGAGGKGGVNVTNGHVGVSPGGGAGGAGANSVGGNAADGQVIITWTMMSPALLAANTVGGSYGFTPPTGISSLIAEAWGAGGSGGAASSTTNTAGGGGGGGEYAKEASLAVTPGNLYNFVVGLGATQATAGTSDGVAGGNSTFAGNAVTVTAHGGSAGTFGSPGAAGKGGTGSTNTVKFAGGAGAAATTGIGGGGGGSGGTGLAGSTATSQTGAGAVAGGGPGGSGGNNAPGTAPTTGPGGGGGGGGNTASTGRHSGAGFDGQMRLTFAPSSTGSMALPPMAFTNCSVQVGTHSFTGTGQMALPPMALHATSLNAIDAPGSVALNPMAIAGTVTQGFAFPQVILALKVELLVGGTWTDITSFVYQRSDITITSRGRADETTTVQPTSCTLTINNRDGRFSPRNPQGPWYGLIGRNTQIRISAQPDFINSQDNDDIYEDVYEDTYDVPDPLTYRFWGEVSAWPQAWDNTGTDVYVQVTASGVLRRLTQGSTLGSALYRYYTQLTDGSVPVSYWPCEDGNLATSLANVESPIEPITWGSTAPTLASNTSFLGSDPLPLMSYSIWSGVVNSFGSSGDDIFVVPGSFTWTAPSGITTVNAICVGGGGGGANGSTSSGGGGGGGELAAEPAYTVVPGTDYQVIVGPGGAAGHDGQDSSFDTAGVVADGGGGASGKTAGIGGSGSGNTTHFNGGNGAAGVNTAAQKADFRSGGNYTWKAPASVTSALVSCWAGGGGGQAGDQSAAAGRPGGGGGEFAQDTVGVTPTHTYSLHVANGGGGSSTAHIGGGNGGGSTFTGDAPVPPITAGTVASHGGQGAIANVAGAGGTGSVNSTANSGGVGGSVGFSGVANGGGGGGGGGGPFAAGASGHSSSGPDGGKGGGGDGNSGPGGNGGDSGRNGKDAPSGWGGGGGGGGGNSSGVGIGGNGFDGRVLLVYGAQGGGGGGGSGGSANPGRTATSAAGAIARVGGGPGGNGGVVSDGSVPFVGPGGGGGGGDANLTTPFFNGANGAPGSVEIIYTPSSIPLHNVFRFLMSVPATGTGAAGNVVVGRMLTNGTVAQLDVTINSTSTALILTGYDVSLTQLFTHTLTTPLNSIPMMVSAELAQSAGSNITYTISTITPGASALTATFTGTLMLAVMGNVTGIQMNAPVNASPLNEQLNDTAIGHITVQYELVPLTNVSMAMNGYAGELGSDRFARLCAEEGYATVLNGNESDTPVMGPQTDQTLLALLQEIEDADRGLLYEPRDSFAIGYRTRISLQNQVPQMQIDYSLAELAAGLTPTEDDQLSRNDVTVSRTNGSSYRVQDTTDAMSVSDPPSGIGRYAYNATVNVAGDGQLAALAAWILAVGTVDELRWPLVTVDLARTEMRGLFDIAVALDIGDFFEILNPPSWTSPGPIRQLAYGFSENLNAFVWTIQINAVPESPYEGDLATW